jgi:hypothetical protein
MAPAVIIALHSAAAKGALSGALAAAVVDFHAFTTWKSFHDAATYNWSTASWRWLQGAITGALVGGGMFWVS